MFFAFSVTPRFFMRGCITRSNCTGRSEIAMVGVLVIAGYAMSEATNDALPSLLSILTWIMEDWLKLFPCPAAAEWPASTTLNSPFVIMAWRSR